MNKKMNICLSDTLKIVHEISSKSLGFTFPNERIFQKIFVDKFIFKPIAVSYSSQSYNGKHIFLKGIMAIFYKGDIIGVFKKKRQEYQTDAQYEIYGNSDYVNGEYDHEINTVVLSFNFEKHKEELRTLFMNEIYGVTHKFHSDETTEVSNEIDLEFLENMVYNFEFSEGDMIPTKDQLQEVIQYYKQGGTD